jgi:hypothetical protein
LGDGGPKNGRLGDVGLGGVSGEGDGAIVTLNRLPPFMKFGILNNFSGIGPLKRLFSTFL